jgi:D-alanyl-D-alanine carboxypeptidase
LFRFAVVGPTEGSITRVRRGFNGRIQIFFCTKDTEVSQTLFRSFYINIGIKTGHTTTAGGCLSSITSIHKDKYEQQELLVIVIGSKDSEYRFKDTKLIVADYQKYIQMMKL